MKYSFLFLFFLSPFFCNAQSTAAKDSILALQLRYDKAIEKQDSVTLASLFHDNMIITGGDGGRRNKQAEIKDCIDPRYNVAYFTTKNIEVDVFGNTAVLRGDIEWQTKMGDKVFANARRITYTWAKQAGSWMIVAQHIGMQPRK